MSEEKWKRFLQSEMDKELEEIEGILEEMNSDPKTKDVVAPEEMHDKLFAQIHDEKENRASLTDEQKELIRLGKVYKKRRKWNKYFVLVAAVVCVLAIGVTSMGGPERVMQKFERMIGDREQGYMNSDDERTDEIEVVSEAEAYQQIEDEFGFNPVQLYYLPNAMKFEEVSIDKTMQLAHLSYQGEEQESMSYTIFLNYRTGSIGQDVEDELIKEYDKEIENVTVNIKKYLVEENQMYRHIISYEYQNIYYIIRLTDIEDKEVEKIIENLYFR